MRNFSKIVGVIICLLLLHSTGFTSKKHMIKFHTMHSSVNEEAKTILIPSLELMKKLSKGELDYTFYGSLSLGSFAECYDVIRTGLVDMGYFPATYTPGRFPLSDVLSMAVDTRGKDISTKLGMQMFERILYQEYKDVKLLSLWGCIQSNLWTLKPIRSLKDLKNLRIRVPGGMQTRYIKELGAEPVFMSIMDVPLALQTGLIDGVITCPTWILAIHLDKILKYRVSLSFGCVTEGIAMNKKYWNSLSKDLQNIIVEVWKNPFKKQKGMTEIKFNMMLKKIKESGVQTLKLSKDEKDRWYKKFRITAIKWAEELEKKGLPAKEVLTIYREECEKLGIEHNALPQGNLL